MYMPYQKDDDFAMYVECRRKILASIKGYYFIILGHFNSAVDKPFQSTLLEFCSSYHLNISGYDCHGRDSGQFTYGNGGQSTTSWLDISYYSHDVNGKLRSIKI